MNQTKHMCTPLIAIVFVLFLSSCGAPKHAAVTPELQTQMLHNLQRGDLTLDCEFDCFWSYLNDRRENHKRFLNGQYEELALSVMRVGLNNNISYFYLGVAAENLGYLNAAEKYYQRSLTLTRYGRSLNRCEEQTYKCEGINLSGELPLRLEKVHKAQQAAQEAAAAELARKQALADPPPQSSRASKAQKNPEILQVQRILVKGGYDVPLDGLHSNKYQNALRKYQKDNELIANGELNEATRKSLGLASLSREKETGKEKTEAAISPPPAKKIETAAVQSVPQEKKIQPAAESQKAESGAEKVSNNAPPPPPAKVAEHRTEKEPSAAQGKRGVLTESASIMAEPNVLADSLGDIRKGTAVEILAEQSNFYKVRSNGKEGYIHSNFVKKD